MKEEKAVMSNERSRCMCANRPQPPTNVARARDARACKGADGHPQDSIESRETKPGFGLLAPSSHSHNFSEPKRATLSARRDKALGAPLQSAGGRSRPEAQY